LWSSQGKHQDRETHQEQDRRDVTAHTDSGSRGRKTEAPVLRSEPPPLSLQDQVESDQKRYQQYGE